MAVLLSQDIILEHDDIWRDKIRSKRFEAFNREWLQLIAEQGGGLGHLSHPDDSGHLLPGDPYGHPLGLHHSHDSLDEDSMGGYRDHGELGESAGDSRDFDHYRDHAHDQEDSEDMDSHR